MQLIHDNSLHVYEPIRLCEREIVSHTHIHSKARFVCTHKCVNAHVPRCGSAP